MSDPLQPGADRGVYGISVAAQLVGMGVQTLRLYERKGLLTPARTEGGTRLYSRDDLDRLRRIGELLDAGLNLAGVARVLELEDVNAQLEDHNSQLAGENATLRAENKEQQQWLKTANISPPTKNSPSIRRSSGRKQTSSNSSSRSTKRR